MKRLKLLFILFILFMVNVKGQTPITVAAPTKIIPPSPTAAALGKYGDIPVSTYTGVANINIPLYTVSAGDISIPISLSYHASGVKVEEDASWSGLGWSVKAGGVITRSIRGLDDLRSSGSGLPYPNYVFPVTIDSANNYVPSSNTTWNDLQFFHDTYGGLKDAEPDVFYFNFGGRSGKFYLGQRISPNVPYTILLSSQEKLKLEIIPRTVENGLSWIITTEDGIKYYFGTAETNTPSSNSSLGVEPSPDIGLLYDDYKPTSSWYLDKIVSPRGEIVEFIYSAPSTGSKSIIAKSETRTFLLNQTIIWQYGVCSPDGGTNKHFYHSSRTVTYDVYLKEILFKNGKIKFTTSNRDDIEPFVPSGDKPQKLDKIQIYAGNTDKGFIEQKSYRFNYGYFTNSDPNLEYSIGSYHYGYSKNYSGKRLKLLELQEQAEGILNPPYKFEYVTNAYGYGDIPDKYSKSRDHWGYFNNANNGVRMDPLSVGGQVSTLIPQASSPQTSVPYVGADREANENFIQLGTLKKIEYPTGGTSEFEYESNEYSNFAPEYQLETVSELALGLGESVDSGDEKLDWLATLPSEPPSILPVVTTVPVTDFTLIARCEYSTDFCATSSQNYGGGGGLIFRSTGNTPFFLRSIAVTPNCDLVAQQSFTVSVPPGTYEVVPIAEGDVITTAFISWERTTSVPLITKKGGGIRIAKTADYDGISHANDVIKRYQYLDEPTSFGTKSSGLLMSFPNYNYTYTLDVHKSCDQFSPNGVIAQKTILNRSSESNIVLGNSAQGNPIGYSRVVVSSGTNGANGQTVYQYLNAPDIVPYFPNLPNQPNQSNGLLTAQIDYKSTLNPMSPFQKVSEIRREYQNEPLATKTTKGMKCLGCELITFNTPSPTIPMIKFYDNTSEWWHIKSETSITYDPNDQTKFSSQKTDYFYDNPVHFQLTKTIKAESDESSIITEYTYPADYVSVNSGPIANMKNDLHMHNALIEKVVKKKKGEQEKVIAASFTGYLDAFGGTTDVPVFPTQLYTLELAVPKTGFVSSLSTGAPADPSYKLKDILKYDAYGNVAEVTIGGLAKTSYIWGHDGSYPVAEIKNALVTDCFYTGFDDVDGDGNSTDAKAGKYSKSDGYQVILVGLTNGSYKLEYWKKTGAAWVPVISNVNVTNGEYLIDLSGHIDEVRFYPATAQMSSFTYSPLVGLTSSNDAKGMMTYYEYDQFQRLIRTRDQDGNIIKAFNYHYKN
jgi:YD repeat-containing protein